jgi:hypothetical protein
LSRDAACRLDDRVREYSAGGGDDSVRRFAANDPELRLV